MTQKRLHSSAWLALLLIGLYHTAEALCSVFVGVYLWVNGQDFGVICRHYLALFMVTPFAFLLAGWYSQARERLHAYRAGLFLHAVYYAVLLVLRERSPEYAVLLGILMGLTWGVFWPAVSILSFDVTSVGNREYYFGFVHIFLWTSRLVAPLISGVIIGLTPNTLHGYHVVFCVAIVLYLGCFAGTFFMPYDSKSRPFRIARALFPGKDQRDWQLIMLAAVSLGGSFKIFAFLLGLLMFMQTNSALSVGGYESFQAVSGIAAAYVLGKTVVPATRRKHLRWGVIFLLLAGIFILWELTPITLLAFGFLRCIAMPMFQIPHFSLRFDTIAYSAQEPAQRIEYLCAWQVPLAIGRVFMMLLILVLSDWLSSNDLGIRLTIFALCATRIITYAILSRVSTLRDQ